MNDMNWIWIAVAVLLALLIVGMLVSAARKKRLEQHRDDAARLREAATENQHDLRRREADAAEAEAKARKARAEADEQSARAQRLQADADQRGEHRDELRRERDEKLREADAVDPDVRTDREGRRLDRTDHGPERHDRRHDDGPATEGRDERARLDDDTPLHDPYEGRDERRFSRETTTADAADREADRAGRREVRATDADGRVEERGATDERRSVEERGTADERSRLRRADDRINERTDDRIDERVDQRDGGERVREDVDERVVDERVDEPVDETGERRVTDRFVGGGRGVHRLDDDAPR